MNSKTLSANNGKVWLNKQLLTACSKVEAKVTLEYEDETFIGDTATYKTYNGFSGEGSITRKKINSDVLNLLKDGIKTGVFPDIEIVTAVTDKATGKTERIVLRGVIFNELALVTFEAKTKIEEELSFSFSDFEVLELI